MADDICATNQIFTSAIGGQIYFSLLCIYRLLTAELSIVHIKYVTHKKVTVSVSNGIEGQVPSPQVIH